jgi:hypothetical protein
MKSEQPTVRRTSRPIASLSIAALAFCVAPVQGAGSGGPDILGIRTGMSPEEVYEALKNIDPTHRVTVGQLPIPALLGNKPAVYAMAPESRNSGGEETFTVTFSLPPNPQQVWSLQRQFNGSIHTTLEQIVDSLHQKYGPETTSTMTPNHPDMYWIFDGKGHLTDPAAGKKVLRECANNGLTWISMGLVPGPGAQVQPGVLSQAYGVNGPIQITEIQDPTKHLECQGWIEVHAYAVGGFLDHGVFNDTLSVIITDVGIQKRAAYALNQVMTGVANKQLQQDLHKATQTAVPKL